MMKLCPVCNGFLGLQRPCPVCGEIARDGGTVEDYYGPYSSFEEDATVLAPLSHQEAKDFCLHLVYCPGCGWDERVRIEQIPH